MIVTQTVQEYVRDINRAEGLKDVIERGGSSTGCSPSTSTSASFNRSNAITLQTAIHAATNPTTSSARCISSRGAGRARGIGRKKAGARMFELVRDEPDESPRRGERRGRVEATACCN